jgi:N-acetyl-beta-hexosaminidase
MRFTYVLRSFFVPAYPRLSATGCYSNVSHTHSPENLTAVVAYARERGIRVVPEFDTPVRILLHVQQLVDFVPVVVHLTESPGHAGSFFDSH